MKFIIKELIHYKVLFVLCIFFLFIIKFIYNYEFICIKNLIDNINILNVFFIIFIVLIRIILNSLYFKIKTRIRNNMNINLSKKIYSKVLNLDYKYFVDNNNGEIVNVLNNSISNICFSGINNFLMIFDIIFSIFSASFMIIKYSIKALIFVYIGFIVLILIMKYINKIEKILHEENFKLHSNLIKLINNSVLCFENIKIFNMQNHEIKKYIDNINDENLNNEKQINIQVFIQFLCNIHYYFVVFSIILFCNLSISTTLTLIMLFDNMYNPIFNFLNLNIEFQKIFVDVRNINKINNYKNEIRHGKKIISSFKKLDIKNLFFKYDNKYILKNINLTINKGEKIGICGHSGNGKSTLIKLLMNFYNGESGEILINDITIQDIDINNLYDKINIVPQNINLMNDTIFNNITYGNNKNIDDVILICKQINIYDFINSLEDKFDTIIGERGLKLSNGQQQRLIIARILLKNPDVIIFDESTSSLDNENEKIIKETINNIKNKTIISIAHRINTIKDFDKIIVLDNNTIVEVGTYNDLMNRKGYFYNLNK